jgi:FtsZ-binding cell division protein ZapB
MERLLKQRDIKLSVDNMVVLEVHFNYGMKKKDPLQKFYFYRKTSPNEAFQFRHDELSKMLPEQFSEDLVRIYWKEESEVTKDLTECIKEACKTIQLSVLWCEEVKESKKKDEIPEADQAKCSAEESSSKEASEHEDQ